MAFKPLVPTSIPMRIAPMGAGKFRVGHRSSTSYAPLGETRLSAALGPRAIVCDRGPSGVRGAREERFMREPPALRIHRRLLSAIYAQAAIKSAHERAPRMPPSNALRGECPYGFQVVDATTRLTRPRPI